jgi:hypothetical protein
LSDYPPYFSLLAPNNANTEWLFENGKIILKANPQLCLSGPSVPGLESVPLVLDACTPDNTSQLFTISNSTAYPFSTIAQGQYIVSVSDNDIILAPPQIGTGIAPCNSSNPHQRILFTGASSEPGFIVNENLLCATGACTLGCYPLPFVNCSESDQNQLWTYSSSNQIVNVASGQCLDIYSGSVCIPIFSLCLLSFFFLDLFPLFIIIVIIHFIGLPS